MPADSDQPDSVQPEPQPEPQPAPRAPQAWPALPYTFRPFGPRIAGLVAGGGLLVVCVVSWFTFDDQTRAEFTPFQIGTLIFVGLLIAAVIYALIRSRVDISRESLTVVNGYRARSFDWAQIVAVQLPQGAPWVTLDLADGSTVSVLAIQSSDGNRAMRAARHLRLLSHELPR